MDTETARLVTEADYLVRLAALMAERGIPAEAHAAGRCTKCGGWIVAMSARDWHQAVRLPCPHCGIKGW